jgi:hypothetical protein
LRERRELDMCLRCGKGRVHDEGATFQSQKFVKVYTVIDDEYGCRRDTIGLSTDRSIAVPLNDGSMNARPGSTVSVEGGRVGSWNRRKTRYIMPCLPSTI